MTKIYHGTSWENWKSIEANGFDPHNSKVWRPSDHEIYFWSDIAMYWCRDIDEWDLRHGDRAAYQALESAQITAAATGSTANKIVALEYTVQPGEIVSSDESCENMDGAVVIGSPSVENVTGLYVAEYNMWYAPFLIAEHLSYRSLLDLNAVDDGLITAAEHIAGKDIEVYEMYEIVWEYLPYQYKRLKNNVSTNQLEVPKLQV